MESRRFIFSLWKSRNKDDFDHFFSALTQEQVLRGMMSARGSHEARFKVLSKYTKDIEKYGYDRITICFYYGQQQTSYISPLSFYEDRMERFGY